MARRGAPSLAAGALAVMVVVVLYLLFVDPRHPSSPASTSAAAASPKRAAGSSAVPPPRALTVLVFPTTVMTDRHEARLRAIRETWGVEGAEYVLSSRWTVRLLFVQPEGVEVLAQDTQRVLSPPSSLKATEQYHWALTEARRRAAVPADQLWLAKADDVTFFVMENLLRYLDTFASSTPVILGNRMSTLSHENFLSGGAGALDRFLDGWEGCRALLTKNSFLAGAPDVGVSRCMELAGVDAVPTRTASERFHAFAPVRLLTPDKLDQWYQDYKKTRGEELQPGLGCCAADTVSFHYVEADLARMLHRALHLSPAERAALTPEQLLAQWPTSAQIGGYCRRPTADNIQTLHTLLLQTIRV